jgi:hypothetical protein
MPACRGKGTPRQGEIGVQHQHHRRHEGHPETYGREGPEVAEQGHGSGQEAQEPGGGRGRVERAREEHRAQGPAGAVFA